MPVEKEVVETYWTWCRKWGVPYPCRKKRTVVRWCYTFRVWRRNLFGPLEYNIACENNFEYTWKKWTWYVGFGTYLHFDVDKCFPKRIPDKDRKEGCSLSGQGIGNIQ